MIEKEDNGNIAAYHFHVVAKFYPFYDITDHESQYTCHLWTPEAEKYWVYKSLFNKTPKNNEKKELGFLQTNTELQTALLCGKIKQKEGFFVL